MDKQDTLNRLKLRLGLIDADIKDEAEAHAHYKEMAENLHAIIGKVTYPEILYDEMSKDEGRHLKNNITIKQWIEQRIAQINNGEWD